MPTLPTELMRMRSFVNALPPVPKMIGPVVDWLSMIIPPVLFVPAVRSDESGTFTRVEFVVAELFWRRKVKVLAESPTALNTEEPLESVLSTRTFATAVLEKTCKRKPGVVVPMPTLPAFVTMRLVPVVPPT